MGDGSRAGRPQGRRLRLPATLGDGFGEVREDDREPQPHGDARGEADRGDAVLRGVEEGLGDRDERRERGTDPDDHHDGGCATARPD